MLTDSRHEPAWHSVTSGTLPTAAAAQYIRDASGVGTGADRLAGASEVAARLLRLGWWESTWRAK
jgi:hypothetical protein